jgi:hypothetical protein
LLCCFYWISFTVSITYTTLPCLPCPFLLLSQQHMQASPAAAGTSASGESTADAATIAAAPGSSAAAAAAAASVMDATPTTGKVCVCIDVMCVQQSNGV